MLFADHSFALYNSCMMSTYAARRQKIHRHKTKSLAQSAPTVSPIERWLRGSYAFFFAAVLPLLCWGGVADPHHTHLTAHFVFAEPLTEEAFAGQNGDNGIVHTAVRDHEPCLHPPGAHPPLQTLNGTEASQIPIGQAVPATVLAQLLVLAMWAIVEFRRPPSVPFASVIAAPIINSFALCVPTPPPRLFSSIV